MVRNKKIKLKNIILILLGISIILAMIWKVGLVELYKILLSMNPYFLLLAFLLAVSATLIKAVRWAYLFRDVRVNDACKVYFIGQAVNQILPTGSGELTRAYIGKSKFDVEFGKTLAYAAVERVADTTFLIAISAIFFALVASRSEFWLYLIFSVCLLAVLYILIFKSSSIERLLGAKPRKKLANLIWKLLGEFRVGVSILKNNHSSIASLITLTIIAWIVNGIVHWVILLSFGTNINLFFLTAIAGAAEIIGAFTFLPGGLGTKDVSFAVILVMLGVQPEVGFGVAVVSRVIGYGILGSTATVSLLTLTEKRLH